MQGGGSAGGDGVSGGVDTTIEIKSPECNRMSSSSGGGSGISKNSIGKLPFY